MDCSSLYAMAGLIALKDRFDLAFGNDTDHDRHGIGTRSADHLRQIQDEAQALIAKVFAAVKLH